MSIRFASLWLIWIGWFLCDAIFSANKQADFTVDFSIALFLVMAWILGVLRAGSIRTLSPDGRYDPLRTLADDAVYPGMKWMKPLPRCKAGDRGITTATASGQSGGFSRPRIRRRRNDLEHPGFCSAPGLPVAARRYAGGGSGRSVSGLV